MRPIYWEASGCTVPFVRLSKLIMLIGALRFLKPAMLNTSPSSLRSPDPALYKTLCGSGDAGADGRLGRGTSRWCAL